MIPGVFVETPAFERERQALWTDAEFQAFQNFLMRNPEAGDVVPDTGGLRKVRFTQSSRGRGKRGGTRVIYFWQQSRHQFWLVSLFSKNDKLDLSPQDRRALREVLVRLIGDLH